METKLTLRLDKKVIEQAKNYASNHKTSLSRMIESYFESLTFKKDGSYEITPLIESLSGVINVETEIDYKNEYTNYLSEKYK